MEKIMELLHSHSLEVVLGGLLVLSEYLGSTEVFKSSSVLQVVGSVIKGAKGFLFPPKV